MTWTELILASWAIVATGVAIDRGQHVLRLTRIIFGALEDPKIMAALKRSHEEFKRAKRAT